MQEKRQWTLGPIAGVPKRDHFPPIVSDQIADFYKLTNHQSVENFRQQEIAKLASLIREMPALPFSEAREREMLRLIQYYEAFATLFGIDLREVARTRTQINATIMYTSPILLQAMFDDKGQEDARGQTFFESRIQAGGFAFNATSINIVEGYPMSFSVLKRTLSDASGEYEINYPAVSLPREAFWYIKRWHSIAYPNEPLGDNPLLVYIADTFSYRIHDWIHQAILYDTNSATKIFQKWSDDSFFVEHFFHDPSMINYEFMSDKIHYLVWQQLFHEYPDLKGTFLMQMNTFLEDLDSFEQWMNTANGGKDTDRTHQRMANFLGYVGLRSLFNIIPINELKTVFENNSRFKTVLTLVPKKYAVYLTKLYEPIDQLAIPFRKGKSTRFSLQHVLEEYVNGLGEEFQMQKLLSISGELWKSGAQNNIYPLLKSLPLSITRQFESNVDMRYLDPRILQMLNKLFNDIDHLFGKDALKQIVSRIEIDTDGYFYFMIDQDEIDTSPDGGFVKVPYRKEAILFQLPWDYGKALTVTLTRSQNVIAMQIGASEQVSPGEIVLVNIDNRRLAKELLNDLGSLNSKKTFDVFWQKLNLERSRGHIALGDVYPYEWDKAKDVFVIESENIIYDQEGRLILQGGFFETKPAYRRATRLVGPVSMNTGKGSTRRRVLYGCVVENHVQKNSVDLFPVDALSFDRFYQADRSSLPPLRFSSIFGKGMEIDSQAASNQAVHIMLENLELINTARIHGFRGKPHKVRMYSLLSHI